MGKSLEVVPFPLYHGTSSYYLSNFKPDCVPRTWPYGEIALNLFRDTCKELQSLGQELDWYAEPVLRQASTHMNWQHGELYLTPSKLSAVRYARDGARYGGELLQFCRRMLDTLGAVDQLRVETLMRRYNSIASFLEGNGWPPLLVQFDQIRIVDLAAERECDDVMKELAFVMDSDERMREIMGQQSNFRLAKGAGLVTQVYEVDIEEVNNPLPNFHLKKLH